MAMRTMTRLVAGGALAVVAAIASPVLAHGVGGGPGAGCPGVSGMNPGQGPMAGGMGHGMMGQGMMGQGAGQGMMGPGMMGQGAGQGMLSHGMMGQGAGQGMMGRGMMGSSDILDRDLTVDDVRATIAHRLSHHGNDRLRVGKVEAQGDDLIVAEIETIDGSLVERYQVDKHTGRMSRAN